MIAPNYLTATECVALVADGKLTVTDIAKAHIERFKERDGEVHAWAYYDETRILAEAARLDAVPKDKRGPLHGATLGVKDNFMTKDMPTEYYSPLYKGHQPGVDAAAVHIAREAGALILGKCHTTEFASVLTGGPARNPYDTRRTPGGSSSGSGAATGDWQCHIAFGTQTIGSVIRPANYNGCFGMKVTWSAISREGFKMTSLTLDTMGFFSRSLTDLKLLASVFRLSDDIPPPVSPKPLSQCSFLYVKTDQWTAGPISDDLPRIWEKSKQLLEAAGAKVTEQELGPEFDKIHGHRNLDILEHDGQSCVLGEYIMDTGAEPLLHPQLRSYVENKRGVTKKAVLAAHDSMAALRPKIDAIAAGYDAIVTPAIPSEAPIGTTTGDARFQGMWTTLHNPLVTVPGFAAGSGMPMSLMLVAPRFEDMRLLSVAEAVAKVWCGVEADKMITLPAPEGAKHFQI